MKAAEHVEALELLRRHPGWSDRRIARTLGVSNSTVGRWRRQEGLAPYRKRVGERRRRAELVPRPLGLMITEKLRRRSSQAR